MFEVSLLNVVVNPVEPLDECIELLLLSEGGFVGEELFFLALVFLLLNGGSRVCPFVVALWRRGHEACSFLHLVGV